MTSAERAITVCIPTYNRAPYLAQSLRSALDQEGVDLRVVISDNASTDDTEAVATGTEDPRVSYRRLPINTGWVVNFNSALELADSPYVTILGDDDILLPGALARAVDTLERHANVGMVHSAFHIIDADGEITAKDVNWTRDLGSDAIETGHDFIRKSMEWSSRVCAPTAVMRQTALPAIPFDPVDQPSADFSLWMRIALHWDIAYYRDPGLHYRVHPQSVSSSVENVSVATGYIQDLPMILKGRATKLRFLATHGHDFPDKARLRRVVTRASHRELVDGLRWSAPEGGRKASETFSAIRDAAALDPAIWTSRYTWPLLGRAFLGAAAGRNRRR